MITDNKTNDDCPCGKIFIEDLGKRSFSCLQTGFVYKSSARTLIFSYIFNQNEQLLNDSISVNYKSQSEYFSCISGYTISIQ